MSVPIPLRVDFDAVQLRGLARKTKDGPQARRLLALAAIYDGAMRIPTIPARDSNLKAATIPIEGGQYCPSARSWGHSAGEASRPDRLAAIFRMLSPFNVSR
jgi:hypothetical protein